MIHDLSLSGYSFGLRAPSAEPVHIEFRPRVTTKRIQTVVANYYNISPAHMLGDSRCHRHAHPRQVAMYLCREMLGRSTPDIGKRFGDRDHTTVLHALKRIRDRIQTNDDLAEDIDLLKLMLVRQ